LGKGCLAGFGVAFAFFAISGLVYVLAGLFSLPENLRLLAAVASGPILGTGLFLLAALTISRRAAAAHRAHNDETTSGDPA
jgi:hypothetical protein